MKLPILIGSHALQHYGLLKGRVPSDWDFIVENESYVRNEKGLDFSLANSSLEKTNEEIFNQSQHGDIVDSPIGKVKVVPLNYLKVLKLSSLLLNKIKNEEDLKQLRNVELSTEDLALLVKREEETNLKVKYQKEEFFNKYRIERFFNHDDLHIYVNPSPKYLSITTSATAVDERLFNQLSILDKKLVLWEEAFVLALERALVPNLRKLPMMRDKICDEFFMCEKSADPSIYFLNKLCEEGQLKDHPQFIQKWGKENYQELLQGYSAWWSSTFDNLDEQFWIKVLTF